MQHHETPKQKEKKQPHHVRLERMLKPPPANGPLADEGSTAIALYGYDPTEVNEITFAEGDRITSISAPSDVCVELGFDLKRELIV